MSAWFGLHIIDHKKFPVALPVDWSGQRKYDSLVAIVQNEGAQWETIEMRPSDFQEALVQIDRYLGGTDLLPLMAFHSSPNWLLESVTGVGSFGYYTPEMVADLYPLLADLEKSLDDFPNSADYAPLRSDEAEAVFYPYLGVMKEASRRHYAVAVLHSW